MTSAIEVHTHLVELHAERALASIEGLAVNSACMAALDGEIKATEIATFRAQLSGRQVG